MATLTIHNISPVALAQYAVRAACSKRTVEEEVLAVVEGRAEPVCVARRPALEYIPSPEIPAPFDPKLHGPGVRVETRKAGHSKLEFWFDEDKVIE